MGYLHDLSLTLQCLSQMTGTDVYLLMQDVVMCVLQRQPHWNWPEALARIAVETVFNLAIAFCCVSS